jgi:soluble lytic murein transglycosylase
LYWHITTLRYWGRITRDRLLKRRGVRTLRAALRLFSTPSDLLHRSRCRDEPRHGTHGCVRHIAAPVAILLVCYLSLTAAPDAVADLKAGVAALDAKRYPGAIASLTPLPKRLPELADYAAWFLASAQSESKDYPDVPKTLELVWQQNPPSPLAARAALLASDAYTQLAAPAQAVEVLRKNYAILPQPEGDLALAKAFEASSDAVSAAVYYQHVFFGYPLSMEAAQAETAIDKLKIALGAKYPPTMANVMLGRALKLVDSGYALRARKELEVLIPQLGGADRDLARVRLGVALYNSRDTIGARRYLAALQNLSPTADAERIYYLYQSARRLKNDPESNAALEKIGEAYPDSPWRLQMLIAVADRLQFDNQTAAYEPLYRACYESFSKDPRAAACHWKVAFDHYLRRDAGAGEMLRAHLSLFPGSDAASAAMYFLGRLAEAAKDPAGARIYYEEIAREYPNQYYAMVARDRLSQLPRAEVKSKTPLEAETFLRSITFPQRSRKWSFDASPVTKARVARAKLLASAGLDNWAEGELRYGAEKEDQPQVMAMELASLLGKGKPEQALRSIKRYANGYLNLPFDSAPRDFWRFAFPLPFRDDLDRFAKANSLDPFLVAALIRQESEFDPRAVSRTSARGLTQIMPETGRELSRRLHLAPYSTMRLFEPAVNLQLGTYYLKMVTTQLGGHQEAALAAYNAGLSRARLWLTWGEFREPSEFIETIPFAETRSYVQIVLRNADLYRRTYGTSTLAAAGQ